MFAALIGITFVAAPAEPPKELPEAAQKELKRLQGKWKVEKMATDGKEFTPDKDDDYVLEIKGRKWIFTGQEKAEIIAIDATTNPKCLDAKSVEKGREGVVEEGVYELDGDALKIAWYQGKGKKRPAGFATPEERDSILCFLRRVIDFS
jgi:uncharacterized protein (TIGR03067 family)